MLLKNVGLQTVVAIVFFIDIIQVVWHKVTSIANQKHFKVVTDLLEDLGELNYCHAVEIV